MRPYPHIDMRYDIMAVYCPSGGGDEAVVGAMVRDILVTLPPAFDIEKAQARYPVLYEESMNQVLCQEMLRYNRLTDIIRNSLVNLDKAVQGLQVMSAELDTVRNVPVLLACTCMHAGFGCFAQGVCQHDAADDDCNQCCLFLHMPILPKLTQGFCRPAPLQPLGNGHCM